MGMTVTWDLDPTAVKYRIYRDTKAFTPGSLPTDVVEVLKDAVIEVNGKGAHEYDDAVRQTVYHLMFCVEDAAGNVSYSERTVMGYFPESGPGPTELLRGTWEFGYFGEVSSTELPSYQDMINALLSAGATARSWVSTNPTAWNKCIVNGRIIFIPTTPLIITTVTVGSSGSNPINSVKATLLDGTVRLRNRDNEFSARLPSAHTDAIGVVNIGSTDLKDIKFINSELAMIAGLMTAGTSNSLVYPSGAKPDVNLSLGDYPVTQVLSSTFISSNSVCSVNATTGVLETTSVYNTTSSYRPILELLF